MVFFSYDKWARAIEKGEIGKQKKISKIHLEDEDIETDSFKTILACIPLESPDEPQGYSEYLKL